MIYSEQNLNLWGWTPEWKSTFESYLSSVREGSSRSTPLTPARVIGLEATVYELATVSGTTRGHLSGRLLHSLSEDHLPLVGDWVAVQEQEGGMAVIQALLPRQTTFSRGISQGRLREKALAANVDVLAIVMGLDANFNPRRAQRLATLARYGGIQPLWILSKVDLVERADALIEVARRAAGADPLIALSALSGSGLDSLTPFLQTGKTIALTGSSGVGKTTLVNRLRALEPAESKPTQSVRESDSKGRHTTSSRHLYRLSHGALLMDTPGLRSVELWGTLEDLDANFEDIAELSMQCRFRDCHHENEPGCAIREALEQGYLAPSRLDGWKRQNRELRYLSAKQDSGVRRQEKERWRSIQKQNRHFSKENRSGGKH